MPAKTRPDCKVQAAPGDNKKYLSHNMEMFNWKKPNMRDETQVIQRVEDYFNLCAKNDMKPSVAGLALAFDVDRVSIYNWTHGGDGTKQLSPASLNVLKKAYKILNAQMEDYMANGKINPVAGIFLMKNNMGYKDQQDVVVSANQQLEEQASPEELQKKYIEDAYGIIDVEPIEEKT